jgi:hypothetical protein
MSEIDLKCKLCFEKYVSEDYSECRRLMLEVFRTIKFRTEALKEVAHYENLGKTLLLMLDLKISDDIDNQQIIASVGYLYLTKALKQSPGNLNIIKDRLLILHFGHDPLKYTVMSALKLNAGGLFTVSWGMSDLTARDAIYKMEIAEIYLNPALYMKVDFFKERKNEFDQKISNEFFKPQITTEQVIDEGTRIHSEMFNYLENRVINELDVDF